MQFFVAGQCKKSAIEIGGKSDQFSRKSEKKNQSFIKKKQIKRAKLRKSRSSDTRNIVVQYTKENEGKSNQLSEKERENLEKERERRKKK